MNKLMSIFTITFLLIINSSNIYGQTQWKTLDNKNFSIMYPATWDLNSAGLMGTKFIILSPLSNSNDKFQENVNLITQDLTGLNVPLDKYVETSENQIKTLLSNGKLLESKRISDNNSEYHILVFTGKQGIFNLKFMQYFRIINNKAYVLTYTAEINQYDKFLPIAKKIMDSFKVIK